MELNEKIKTLQDSILDQISGLESDIDFCERSLAENGDTLFTSFTSYFKGRKVELLNRRKDLAKINASLQSLISNK